MAEGVKEEAQPLKSDEDYAVDIQNVIIVQPQNQDIPMDDKMDDNIPLDNNQVTPSQDQIAAILPPPSQEQIAATDDVEEQSGIGYIAGCQESPHIVTWLCTICMWTMLILGIIGIIVQWWYWYIFWIVAGVIYIIYLIETGCSAMHKYLSNVLEKEGATEFIERLKHEPIQIWWHVRCYHYETRTRVVHSTDSNGNRRTRYETYQEKVYTWSATQQYQYNVCIDISGDIHGLDEHKLTRLRLHKAYQFADDNTKQNYIYQQEMFKRNNWRDAYQEFNEETKINGYIERILAESEPGIKPKWMDVSIFWLFSIVACSPCYRQAIVARCGNIDFALIKQISSL